MMFFFFVFVLSLSPCGFLDAFVMIVRIFQKKNCQRRYQRTSFFNFVSLWTIRPHAVLVWLYPRVISQQRLSNLISTFPCLEVHIECHLYFWAAFEKHWGPGRWSSWVMFFVMVKVCEKEILMDLINLLRLKKRKKLQFIVVLRANYIFQDKHSDSFRFSNN